ncbi:MAG TPA: hypothetical protein VFQ44_13145 [Streptosporangiaceae bacterium]|nr:hypothetical protein [Streptosporangiaceae bacterium]
MRHLVGLILALVLGAALYFGAGWGVERVIALHGAVTNHGAQHGLTSPAGLFAVAAVAGTGLLLGILLTAPRVSPLATGLPGLALLGWSALVVIHSQTTLRYVPMPGSHFTAGITYLLFNGILGLLGAAMIIPLAIPSRWYRRDTYVDEAEEDYNVQHALGLVP